MKPKRYPYSGKRKKELVEPVQYDYPEQAFSDFVTKAFNNLNPNREDHIVIACNLMDKYQYYS
ncbi:hypothetical protein MX041_03315 [Streptococcus uberis]|nr:hypothetical protein [Streptococcus uberis]MCK1242409.1 hypothetical protein [Streptococcus uberis]